MTGEHQEPPGEVLSYGPSVASPGHSCVSCRRFVLDFAQDTEDASEWQMTARQTRIATTLFGSTAQDKRFLDTVRSYRLVFFDVSTDDVTKAAKNGCRFCQLLKRKLNLHSFRFGRSHRVLVATRESKSVPDDLNSVSFGVLKLRKSMRDRSDYPDDLDDQLMDIGSPDSLDEVPRFVLCTDAANPARAVEPTRPVNLLPGSEESLRLPRQWLHDCMACEDCHVGAQARQNVLPTRLIQILPQENKLRLLEPRAGSLGFYVALSYCWGGDQQFWTTKANIQSMCRGFLMRELPPSLYDAIRVTKSLGQEYLWVDALCIIQDDKDDKSREIGRMARIYSNALVTIIASRAHSVRDGFLGPRTFPETIATLPVGSMGEGQGSLSLLPWDSGFLGPSEVQHPGEPFPRFSPTYEPVEPLYKRAWCFQEFVLSGHVLIYGSRKTTWICQTSTKRRHWGDGWSSAFSGAADEWHIDYGARVYRLLRGLDPLDPLDQHQRSWLLCTLWTQCITEFSQRSLTNDTDLLPAIGAVAERFARISGDTYVAGLWQSQLIPGLLWVRSDREGGDRRAIEHLTFQRPSEYIAPSWSWAAVAVECTIHFVQSETTKLLEHVQALASTQPALSDAPFASVRSGELSIRGPVRRATWFQNMEEPLTGTEGDVSLDCLLPQGSNPLRDPTSFRPFPVVFYADFPLTEGPAGFTFDVLMVPLSLTEETEYSTNSPRNDPPRKFHLVTGLVLSLPKDGKCTRLGCFLGRTEAWYKHDIPKGSNMQEVAIKHANWLISGEVTTLRVV